MSFFDWLMGLFRRKPPPAEADPSTSEPEAEPEASAAPAKPAGERAPVPAETTDDAGNRRLNPQEIRILVSEFKGDREGQFTERFVGALGSGQMIEIQQVPDAPTPLEGTASVAKLTELFTEASDMVEEQQADLFVSGSLTKAGMRLRLIPPARPPEGRPEAFGWADSLLVPPNFGVELATLIYASAIAAALPGKRDHQTLLTPHLIDAAEKSLAILKGEGGKLTAEQTASVMTHLGVVAASVWKVTGKSGGLNTAIKAFRRAVKDGPKEITPTVLTELKVRLAVALQELTEITGDAEMLDEAADALETVAGALSRSKHKREWSMAYRQLGSLFLRRGKKELNTDYCVNALAAFDAVKDLFPKDEHPARWIEVMNQRGAVYVTWGTIGAGTGELQTAVDIYREVLAERHQAVAPLLWAQASNNLGSAAFALAKRTGDAKLLQEAAGCFDGALAVYQEQGQTKAVAAMQKNLQRVERLQSGGGG